MQWFLTVLACPFTANERNTLYGFPTELRQPVTRLVFLCVAVAVTEGCTDTATIAEPILPSSRVMLEGDVRPPVINNRYLVVLRSDVPSAAAASAALVAHTGGVRFYVYETALKGFAVANLPPAAVEALKRNPLVLFVEEDRLVQPLQSVQYFTPPSDSGLYLLDRVDQRYLPLNWQYAYSQNGAGVHIYIVDSGVSGGHQEWGGYARLGNGAAFIKWSMNPSPWNDPLGHGTAVAGAAAGSRVGVAKGAIIHSVRIDDGSSPAHESDLVAGLNWVAENRILPAVVNLSYDHNSNVTSTAAQGVMNRGVTFVVAAGNSGVDACNPTTQRSGILTVGATGKTDHRASYSNIGPCVDLFAPGGDYYGHGLIELASNQSVTSYRWSSGTSFAAPIAAGVAALVLQQSPSLAPAVVAGTVTQWATSGVVVNAGAGSPNKLLYSRITVAPPPPSSTASITGYWSVEPYASCMWSVSTNLSDPTAYEWTVNSQPVGSNSSTLNYANTGASFTLAVLIRNALGHTATDSKLVTVAYGAGQCNDF